MISCPNKRLKAWKDLEKAVGENKAYGLWNKYKGEVPSMYYMTEKPSKTNEEKNIVNLEDIVDKNSNKEAFTSIE